MNCMGQVRRQDVIDHGGLLVIPTGPAVPMLHELDGKELPELFEGHVGQGFGHR